MKSQTIHSALLIIIFFLQLGCSQESHSDEQNRNALANINSYDDFSLLDSDLPMNQLTEMENSEDPKLDQEDPEEIKSGKDKILIIGDSWAAFPCLYNSLGTTIKDVDAKIIEDNRCLRTSKLGIEARQWINSKQDLRVIKFLKKTPKLKYIYLSLGGNDLMGSWNKDFTAKQELQLFAETFNIVQKIIKNYLVIRPDIKIILSGYDFPHFKPNHPIGLYKKIYERMGSPSDLRLNRALVRFSQFMVSIADRKNIFYIQHLGLSQYYDGVPEKNYPAKLTLAPDEISPFNDPGVVGGDINFPSSEKSMINWLFLAHDAFHLNHENYRNLMHHTYDNVLVKIIP